MVAPRFRTKRKTLKRSTKGKKIVLYKERKPSKKKCFLCQTLLQGVPNRRPSELKKLSKTEKRPERLFGGVLCGKCVQQILKEKTRLKTGIIKKGDVPVNHLTIINKMK